MVKYDEGGNHPFSHDFDVTPALAAGTCGPFDVAELQEPLHMVRKRLGLAGLPADDGDAVHTDGFGQPVLSQLQLGA
jgi:hypothetical protein